MKEKDRSVSCNGVNGKQILRWAESCLEDDLLYNGVAFEDAILILPVGKKQ